MNQHLFGGWGLGLSPEDFSQALAAMGVSDTVWPQALAEDAIKQLVNSHMMVNQPHSGYLMQWRPKPEWRLPWPTGSANDWIGWAHAWARFRKIFKGVPLETGVQFELDVSEPGLLVDTVEALATPAVDVNGIYVRQDQPEGEVRWNWPLRVGFLDDEESRRLHKALMRLLNEGVTSWRRDYIELLEPGNTGGLGCHLLLLPGGLEHQMHSLRNARGVVRAACVLMLGAMGDPGVLPVRMNEVRKRSRAEGVAVIDLPDESLRAHWRRYQAVAGTPEELWGSWFIEVVRNLSHNQSLDEALLSVWRSLQAEVADTPSPIVIASRRLIRESRISFRLARVASQLRDQGMGMREINLGPRTVSGLYSQAEYERRGSSTPPASLRFVELADYLERNAKSLRYDSESDSGTAALELVKALRKVRRERPAQEPRWLQALVYEAIKTDQVRAPLRAFRPGANYEVAIFIGPREEGAIQPPSDAPPVPEGDLPNDRGVRLTVVFATADNREPQVQTIFLPRRGKSEMARFTLKVGTTEESVQARIIVLYRNRVLQTSVLRGKPGGSPSKGEEITIDPEVLLHRNFDRLEHRSDFDAALVLNDRGSGGPAITALRDGTASKLKLPSRVEKSAEWFDKVMEGIADNADDFTSFANRANIELLIRMAREGSLLWSQICESLPMQLAKCDRIQVISADASTRLPIEFFYDLKAPETEAQMCPGAAKSLREGEPCAACASRAPEDAENFVCPLGFWGLRKVLERQLHGTGADDGINSLCVASPVEGREVLTVIGEGSCLLAASDKVDAHTSGGIDAVAAALGRACAASGSPTSHSPLPVIRDWEEWRRQVKAQAFNMLFIMPHLIEDEAPVLEIGEASRRHAANIDYRDVGPAGREPSPLVVLLGCKTGNPRAPFADLIGPFRRHGAAIVLCTGAPIVGRHAARVATALVKALEAATTAPSALSVGDVIQRVRRHMVAHGLPMVFTLLAFGDHDWQIGRLPIPHNSAGPIPTNGSPAKTRGGVLVTS